MTAALLAGEDGFLALDEGRIHETVVDHDIGGRQCIVPAHRYQSGITRAIIYSTEQQPEPVADERLGHINTESERD
jgi:hypothetical protein